MTSDTPRPTQTPPGSQSARSIDILRAHPWENVHVKMNASRMHDEAAIANVIY
jgi:hypothetical protein